MQDFIFPENLNNLIQDYLKEMFTSHQGKPWGPQDTAFFAKGVAKLSEFFTSDRNHRPRDYFNDKILRSGYLAYFLPLNIAKTYQVLNALPPCPWSSGTIRILDIGAGPGAGVLGSLLWLHDRVQSRDLQHAWLEYNLIDQNYHALKDAQSLHDRLLHTLDPQHENFKSLMHTKTLNLHHNSLFSILRGFRYDLIVLSHLLNEWGDQQEKVKLVSTLLANHVQPTTGRLVIIEPALRFPTRGLQALRDVILANGSGKVMAPCLHQETCPLNHVNQRDWCHFYFPWQAPPLVKKMDALVGHKNFRLEAAYLALATNEGKKPTPNLWRVISNPMASRGKKEIVLCGELGRIKIARLNRNQSPANSDFDSLRRGDLVSYHAATKKLGFKEEVTECIAKDSQLARH